MRFHARPDRRRCRCLRGFGSTARSRFGAPRRRRPRRPPRAQVLKVATSRFSHSTRRLEKPPRRELHQGAKSTTKRAEGRGLTDASGRSLHIVAANRRAAWCCRFSHRVQTAAEAVLMLPSMGGRGIAQRRAYHRDLALPRRSYLRLAEGQHRTGLPTPIHRAGLRTEMVDTAGRLSPQGPRQRALFSRRCDMEERQTGRREADLAPASRDPGVRAYARHTAIDRSGCSNCGFRATPQHYPLF